MLRLAVILAIIAMMIAIAALAAEPPAAPAKPKTDAGYFEVAAPFAGLAKGDVTQRAAALEALLPRGAELQAAARAEAERLRQLELPETAAGARHVREQVSGLLLDFAAEAELMKSWKKGLPAGANPEKVAPMTCQDKPIREVLAMASRGWGVTFELSPCAAWLNSGLSADLEGAPSLKDFLDWLEGHELVAGSAGGKIVLVPPGSAKMKKP